MRLRVQCANHLSWLHAAGSPARRHVFRDLFDGDAGSCPTPEEWCDAVVTRDDFLPADYDERMQTRLKVSARLREINKTVPIDLIVHTRPMHQAFVRLDSVFAWEVMRRRQVLYERDR